MTFSDPWCAAGAAEKRARAFKEKRDKQWKLLGMREMKADLHDAKAKRAKGTVKPVTDAFGEAREAVRERVLTAYNEVDTLKCLHKGRRQPRNRVRSKYIHYLLSYEVLNVENR